MATAKLQTDYDRTAAQMALYCNMHRKPGSAAIKPAELNPYRERTPEPVLQLDKEQTLQALRALCRSRSDA